jgi:hypothetical protein
MVLTILWPWLKLMVVFKAVVGYPLSVVGYRLAVGGVEYLVISYDPIFD